MLRNPAEVSVTPVATTAERVTQQVFLVDGGAKREVLLELLQGHEISRAIVFTRTKRGADRVAMHLENAGVGAEAIHGNKSQNQRQRALDGFRKGHTRVLVATYIAARGIDIDGVTHVFNYELPDTPEAYVHRIGRTARAGASGQAISLCDNAERSLLRAIEKITRQSLPIIDRRSEDARQNETLGESVRGKGKPAVRARNAPPRGRRDGARSSEPKSSPSFGKNSKPSSRSRAGDRVRG
jgi:ATP-dependent RNA helicase RhlE